MKKSVKITVAASVVCLIAIIGSGIWLLVKNNDGYITKKQWMEMLDSMTYFQSSYYTEDEGNEIATGEFIALTSMEMIGETRLNIYMRSMGKTEYDSKESLYIDASDEFDFIKRGSLNEKIPCDEIDSLFADFNAIYHVDSWVDDFVEITYNEDLVAIRDEDIVSCENDLSAIKVTNISAYKVGDIVGFTDQNIQYPAVRKIESISEDGTLTLSEDLEVSDIVTYAICSDIEAVSLDNMMLLGFEKITTDTSMYARPVSFWDGMELEGFNFSVHVVCEDGETYIELEDKGSGTKYISPFRSFENDDSDYDITLDISNLYAKACWEFDYAKGGFQYAEAVLTGDISLAGQIGSIELVDRKIKLFDSAIPIADGALWVKFEFYVVFDAEGNVSLEMGVPINIQGAWEKDSGLQVTKQATDITDVNITGEIAGNFMFRGETTLALFWLWDIIDLEADVGATASASATIRSNGMVCSDIELAFPVVKISVCGDKTGNMYRSLIGQIVGSLEIDIVDKENALYHKSIHYERRNGVGSVVDECTYGKEEQPAGSGGQGDAMPDTMPDAEEVLGQQNQEFHFLYSSPTEIEIRPKLIDEENFTDEMSGITFYSATLDITDTGTAYRINVGTVIYDLVVGTEDFELFINNAVSDDGDSTLTCMGEKFILISCETGDTQGGYRCKFMGEDGEQYELNADSEPLEDAFTGETYWMFSQGGKQVTRTIRYNEDVYIEIPYAAVEEHTAGRMEYVIGYRIGLNTVGAGQYYIQLDADGKVIKMGDFDYNYSLGIY